jgi:hypothetical protein
MTDTATEAPEDTATESAPAEETKPDTSATDEVAKWKALARKHEQQAKANADKAKRLDELEEASKSEQQKLMERAEAAEKAAADAQSRLLRAEVAAQKGLTAQMAARLVGSTKEELEADADELLADLAAKFTPKTASPQETGAGVGGNPAAKQDSPEEVAARLKSQGHF